MKKEWIICIGIEKFEVTTSEKNDYLRLVNEGKKFVVFPSGMVLGSNFQYIISMESIEEKKLLGLGMWKCFICGEWHDADINIVHKSNHQCLKGAVPCNTLVTS